jgi:hypothetical protein
MPIKIYLIFIIINIEHFKTYFIERLNIKKEKLKNKCQLELDKAKS